MIQIKLTKLYNRPYYEIYKNGELVRHVYGYDQIKEIYNDAKKRKEKVELDDSVLEEHSKLVALLNSNKKQIKKLR